MIAITAFLALLAAGAAAGPPAAAAPPAATPPAPALNVLSLAPASLDAGGIDPALGKVLPGLLAAALESGGAFQVVPAREGAGWDLSVLVAGRGPWKLSARAEPLAPGPGGHRLSRVATRKETFTGREDLTRAVDAIAADLAAAIGPAAGGAAAAGPATVPLAQALSPSTGAVDAWLDAMRSLRGGDPDGARESLKRALEADAAFCAAASETAFLEITAGRSPEAAAALARARSGGACRTPDADATAAALDRVARGDGAGALQAAESLAARGSSARWSRVIHGLALSAAGRARDAAGDWRAAALAAPDDPRPRMWLGNTLMATGSYAEAADAFGRARKGWPGLLDAYALQAEALVRARETAPARQAITEMRSYMTAHGLVPDDDIRNAELMLGSLDLLEGHTESALKKFELALDELEGKGAPPEMTERLHNAVIEMRRDLIVSRDPVERGREAQVARDAIDRYQSSQTPEHRISNPWVLLRLKGLVFVRDGKTVDAWKIVDEIKSHASDPGYSEYYEAYLTAAILMKEGDDQGSTAQFARAAKSRDHIVDLIDLAQMQGNIRDYKASHATYEEIARRLSRYDPAPGAEPGPMGEIILIDPHLAAMIPIYHYTWARLAFETDNPTESRLHFNQMLKYLQHPDQELMPLVREAVDRGAHPE